MVHDADLEDEKFDRKEAVGIELMLKGLAHMENPAMRSFAPALERLKPCFAHSRAGIDKCQPTGVVTSLVLMPVMDVRVMRVSVF